MTLNKNIIEGEWHQIKGEIEQQWGKLTKNDIAKIHGSLEALAGALEKEYGYNKERAHKEIDEFLKKHHLTEEQLNKDALKNKWDQLKSKVKHQWADLTTDEIEKIHGSFDKLSSALEETYRYNQKQAHKEINEFMKKLHIAEKKLGQKTKKF